MFIKQLYTGCLSEAAYYIESNGEAAVIDPLRDIDAYLELANQRKTRIKYIFETHFHADFVSGHLDLAQATGAPIVYGPGTETKFPVHIAKDGETFKIGDLTIEVLHTPGHTLESSCYLLKDSTGKDHCVFTGDTLFVGDVGRPDLAQKSNEITMNDLAGMMYESIHSKLFPLADDVIVYPAHGPGSSCGKNLGKETWSSIGVQKQSNYALKEQPREEFIHAITEGLSTPPQYFPLNAKINREGYSSLDSIMSKSHRPLTLEEFEAEMKNPGTIVVDTRHQDVFEKGFIPGSIFIGLRGRFAEWVGTVLNMNDRILLVTEKGKEEESIMRMARVGYENVIGFLKGSFDEWKNSGRKYDMVISIDAEEFLLDYNHDDINVVDVRKENEFKTEHVDGAVNAALQNFGEEIHKLDQLSDNGLYVYCEGGYRSMIAASLMKRNGFRNLKNISGGWNAISKSLRAELPKFSAS